MTTETRTDDELNRIIAEWMGWRNFITLGGVVNGWPETPPTVLVLKVPGPDPVPNYCRDLNAVHEAERALSNGTLSSVYDRFEIHLAEVCFLEGHRRNMIHSSARQRAEALVKVIEST